MLFVISIYSNRGPDIADVELYKEIAPQSGPLAKFFYIQKTAYDIWPPTLSK